MTRQTATRGILASAARLGVATLGILATAMVVADLTGAYGRQTQQVAIGLVALIATATVAAAAVAVVRRQRPAARHRNQRAAASPSIDPLTGLWTQLGFCDHTFRAWDDAAAAGEAVVGLAIGIDNLDGLAAAHGQRVADQAEQRTATALDDHLGTYGVVGRIGPGAYAAMLTVPAGQLPTRWATRQFWQARTALLKQACADEPAIQLTAGIVATIPNPVTVTAFLARTRSTYTTATTMHAPLCIALAPTWPSSDTDSDAGLDPARREVSA